MLSGFLIGSIIIGITALVDFKRPPKEKFLRVDLDFISKFLAFMVIVTAFRLCTLDFLIEAVPEWTNRFLKPFQNMTSEISLWRLGVVWWEDAFFVLPVVYMQRYSKKVWIPFAALIFACFGMGHAYQGIYAIFISMCYPILSLNLGREYGYGTMMVCHVLFDIIGFLTIYSTLNFI